MRVDKNGVGNGGGDDYVECEEGVREENIPKSKTIKANKRAVKRAVMYCLLRGTRAES